MARGAGLRPDLFAASRAGRVEAGIPLWKRLAYVAITRAEERLIWVTRYAMARPVTALGVADLARGGPDAAGGNRGRGRGGLTGWTRCPR